MADEVGSGTLLGRQIAGYQVLALLGAGGMGEVYRARDTRLGRDVALKVLQRHRAADPAHQARFQREAQAASALSHPNILAVYDVGVEDGLSFIVTELIDGTSLREVVERGPLPIKKLLDLATQIADGLATAHEAGIVHRDLKPENLMVTRDGRAKILDFGLALAPVPTAPAGEGTLHVTQTETGLIQGTVPYMSPEQARGESGDFRSDQFSFGLMLYEMTTGTRAFQRETPVQTLSAIITDDAPPITELHSRVPVQLRWPIERCLAKDPLQRYAATRDLALDLKTLRDRLAETTTVADAVPDAARRRILIIVGTSLAMAVGSDVWLRPRPTDSPIDQFPVPPPKGATFVQASLFMAVSPDGQSIVFVASSPEGKNALWIRALDSLTTTPLPGTDGAAWPYWSPDGRFVAFSVQAADGRLRTQKINISRGSVETLDEYMGPGTWNFEDIIVGPLNDRITRGNDGLFQISALKGNGSAKAVTTLEVSRDETAHRWPYFLPDGRHFLYVAASRQPQYDGFSYVGSLDSTPVQLLPFPVDSQVVYVAPGYLLYMRATRLWAVRFDVDSLSLVGSPVPIVDHVECTFGLHCGAFSVSRAGDVIAYRMIGETQLTWVDRAGQPRETIGSPALYGNPALSPNERVVAVNRLNPLTGRTDIWLIEGGRESQFTSDPSDERKPLWYGDGNRLMFLSNKTLPPSFYSKPLSGEVTDPVLSEVGPYGTPLGWSQDGSLLYEMSRESPHGGIDLWILPLTGDRTPVHVLRTRSNEAHGQLSSNGRWIAYESDKTGRREVYVQPFPSGGSPQRVSTNGGIEPKWVGDGTELFYLALDHRLMSVAIKETNHTLEIGVAQSLFETRMSTASDRAVTRNQYDVTRDGRRFLLNQSESPTPITVVVNWTSLLKR